eukprot:1151611-Pelagomonas_calceolata.AAC.7
MSRGVAEKEHAWPCMCLLSCEHTQGRCFKLLEASTSCGLKLLGMGGPRAREGHARGRTDPHWRGSTQSNESRCKT